MGVVTGKNIHKNDWQINKRLIIYYKTRYEKYKVIQDKKFISDFDKLLLETENINKNETQ